MSDAYDDAKAQGQELLEETLLQVASQLLAQGGSGELSMRRIAQEAGCSTTVLYNLFGSKQGILDALAQQGFKRLQAAHTALPVIEDTIEQLVAMCRSYRQLALLYPSHYAIMFGSIPDYEPSYETKAIALGAMHALASVAQAAIDARRLHADNAEALAMSLWAAAHGFVSLELAKMLPHPAQAEVLYLAMIRRLL
jgi:AcrR family transcriptional regulator